jgi:26S proteasome regulatory subunit N2
MNQDEKLEPKKEVDGDVEMKDESEPTSKHGDISPINGSLSNLADDGKTPTSASKQQPRRAEPSFEMLPNFSRVTPSQLACITFPSEGRYQPVRAVAPTTATTVSNTSKSPNSTPGLAPGKYGGGGGILILADLLPDEEAEFIEFSTAVVVHPAEEPAQTQIGNGHAVRAPQPTGPHIEMDDAQPEVDPPEPFEVRSARLLIACSSANAVFATVPL